MKLFHKHSFRVYEAANVDVYNFEAVGDPDRVDTRLLRMCTSCGKLKVDRFKGVRMTPDMVREMASANEWIVENDIFEVVEK